MALFPTQSPESVAAAIVAQRVSEEARRLRRRAWRQSAAWGAWIGLGAAGVFVAASHVAFGLNAWIAGGVAVVLVVLGAVLGALPGLLRPAPDARSLAFFVDRLLHTDEL